MAHGGFNYRFIEQQLLSRSLEGGLPEACSLMARGGPSPREASGGAGSAVKQQQSFCCGSSNLRSSLCSALL